jgi:hypothetical protein
MNLFDILAFVEILGRTTFLGTLSLTVLPVHFNLICMDVQRSFGLITIAAIESLRD